MISENPDRVKGRLRRIFGAVSGRWHRSLVQQPGAVQPCRFCSQQCAVRSSKPHGIPERSAMVFSRAGMEKALDCSVVVEFTVVQRIAGNQRGKLVLTSLQVKYVRGSGDVSLFLLQIVERQAQNIGCHLTGILQAISLGVAAFEVRKMHGVLCSLFGENGGIDVFCRGRTSSEQAVSGFLGQALLRPAADWMPLIKL